MPAALAVGMYSIPANAATVMTVNGPIITTADYLPNGAGVLEQRWRYDITNISNANEDMFDFHINAGISDGILAISRTYTGSGNIKTSITPTSFGFTGVLPSTENNNVTSIYIYTSATTLSVPGLATATGTGNVSFSSQVINKPSIVPEPSSGLLVLLGAGALLYRKR
jgi:hypothetical protein